MAYNGDLGVMSDKDINALIDAMCNVREENQDVQILDSINNHTSVEYDKNAEERSILQESIDIETEIFRSMITSGEPLSQEAINLMEKKPSLYAMYMEITNPNSQIDDKDAIEAEIMRSLASTPAYQEDFSYTDTSVLEEVVEEVEIHDHSFQVSDEEVLDVNQSNVVKLSKESIDEEINTNTIGGNIDMENTNVTTNTEEDLNVQAAIDEGFKQLDEAVAKATATAKAAEEEDKPMSIEELNDVPAVELEVADDNITKALEENYGISDAKEAFQLIDVMKRYKNKEKFNVFEALPESIKSIIQKEAMENGIDRSAMNFFAKSFINDLVSNSYMETVVKDFQQEMNEVLEPLNNIAGTMIDEYSDELYDKFTVTLLQKAEEIKDTEPEKYETIIRTSEAFKQAVGLDRVIETITNKPSLINRAYKTARDRWDRFVSDYTEAIAKVNPSPKSIEDIMMGVLYMFKGKTENLDTVLIRSIIVLIGNSVIEAINKDSVEERAYAYYSTLSLFTAGYTAKGNKSRDITVNGINVIFNKAVEYMASVHSSKKKNK